MTASDPKALIERLRATAASRKRVYAPIPDSPTWEDIQLFHEAATALETQQAEIASLRARVAELEKPITMQDVRLCAGEGKLSASTVLQAVNAILNRRAAAFHAKIGGGET